MQITRQCFDHTFILAKTPWSWGRMDAILSEGRKIESRRQLKTRHRINRNAKLKFGNEAKTPARE